MTTLLKRENVGKRAICLRAQPCRWDLGSGLFKNS